MMDEAQSRSATDAMSTDSGPYPSFAFLVHSHTSLTQNLPPKVDMAMTARQKRRRTSPEDHAILEAAYQKNSKPDKSERMEIVSRVALGEKEVQIWFQNRRQNDRRKSRPLLPHELVPHFRNSIPQQLLDASLPSEDVLPNTQINASLSPDDAAVSTIGRDPFRSSSRASSIHDLLNPQSTASSQSSIASAKIQIDTAVQASTSFVQIVDGTCSKGQEESIQREDGVSEECKQSPVGTKRAFEETNFEQDSGNGVTARRIPCFQSPTSHVRLSISLDGAVKVKTTEDETPSPPKQRAPPPTSLANPAGRLQRSKSAILSDENQLGHHGMNSRLRQQTAMFGRSRDARTWEFYCDGDAREALSSHAESERNGSAVGAINLIRSQSQKLRGNANLERMEGSNNNNNNNSGTNGKGGSRHKLSRARSSMSHFEESNHIFSKSSKPEKAGPLKSPSGDSDKENWAPGTRSSQNPLRRQHKIGNSHRVLGENIQTASQSTDLKVLSVDQRRGTAGQAAEIRGEFADGYRENRELFERGGKGEDLDCIHGLLSLSQGAWR